MPENDFKENENRLYKHKAHMHSTNKQVHKKKFILSHVLIGY